jgi:hypothetical protein
MQAVWSHGEVILDGLNATLLELNRARLLTLAYDS